MLRKRQVDVDSSELDMSGGNEHKEIRKAQREARAKEIRQGSVAYVEHHVEDLEGFLVNEKRTQQLGALEGERQRTVKEWCTFMGQPTEYGDNILIQTIVLNLKKPVQSFSYDYEKTELPSDVATKSEKDVCQSMRGPSSSQTNNTSRAFVDVTHYTVNTVIIRPLCVSSSPFP